MFLGVESNYCCIAKTLIRDGMKRFQLKSKIPFLLDTCLILFNSSPDYSCPCAVPSLDWVWSKWYKAFKYNGLVI